MQIYKKMKNVMKNKKKNLELKKTMSYMILKGLLSFEN